MGPSRLLKKKKKKTAQKYIFIARRSQGHMQMNFIVSFCETAASCFSFFFFVCFRLLFLLCLRVCLFHLFVCFFLRSLNSWFSRDATKIQTKKLSILPGFYFHDALEQLKTNFHTNIFL